jgi:hypothetical protein
VRSLSVGDWLHVTEERDSEGETWYLHEWNSCWVYGPLTTESDDVEQALLTIADRILARTDDVAFEEYVAVHNLLTQSSSPGVRSLPSPYYPPLIEGSPILQLRRLQVLAQAFSPPDLKRSVVVRDPLTVAWVASNRDVLKYYEPAGAWYVFSDKFWALYERHPNSPRAEEIAWAAARGQVGTEECDGPCIMEQVGRTFARYWATYPSGRWVEEALAQAAGRLERSEAFGCVWRNLEDARRGAGQIEASHSEVTDEGKEEVLARVTAIKQACGGALQSRDSAPRHSRPLEILNSAEACELA